MLYFRRGIALIKYNINCYIGFTVYNTNYILELIHA